MKIHLFALLSLVLLGLVSCSVTTEDLKPRDGFVDVRIEDVPPCCDGQLEVKVEIRQTNPSGGPDPRPLSFNATAQNGRLSVKTYNAPESRGDAQQDLFWDHPIDVRIIIGEISECCLDLLRQRLNKPNVGRLSTLEKKGIGASGSGNVWSSSFDGSWTLLN
jgi:hypothetical protein